MPLIPFPNVPLSPGVPPIPRSPLFPPVVQTALGITQALLWRMLQIETRWGIFDADGNALGDPSIITGAAGAILEGLGLGSTLSTNGIEYSKETRVSTFPIERGSFASFNKVEMPAEPTITLVLGGNESARAVFLSEIDNAVKSTKLYNVVTPEVTYVNYSLERYDYLRKADKGCTLLVVNITLTEVREVSAQYAKTDKQPKQPSAHWQINAGKVQPKAPEQSTLKSIAGKAGLQ